MLQLPIQPLPNQEFQALLDGNSWDFTIRSTNGVISITLALNGDIVIENIRCVAGALIIPSRYEESGNFLFLTANNQLPEYPLFGVTQSFVYVNAAELASLRLPPIPPISAAFFNPIAALPLRFAPQNYMLA